VICLLSLFLVVHCLVEAFGALADLGITPSTFEWELSKLELGDCHLHFERQTRGGISGVKFEVHGGATHVEAVPDTRSPESHHHAHSDASSRRFSEIRELLRGAVQRQDEQIRLYNASIERQAEQHKWYVERHETAKQEQQRVIDAYKRVILTNTLLVAAVVVGIAIAIFAAAHR